MFGSDIRKPVYAGKFYPADPETLRAEVARYIEDSGVEAAPERVLALVAPHAGYLYSGPTAGHAYARARGKRPRRVVLLGRSHHYGFDGCHVYASGAFETPLGTLPIDEEFARSLSGATLSFERKAHLAEHALEVQLPFLQASLGDTPIVPLLFGSDPASWHVALGEQLASLLDEDDLVIASTDLSHYKPQEVANELDRHSIDMVLAKDCARLAEGVEADTCPMCGATAVLTAMACAKMRHADDWRLLDYRTSAEVTGDYGRVVGYGALSMERAA